MKLNFLGATRTVTGSKYLLSIGNKKILIDCGLFQGLKELRLKNWDRFPVSVDEIDAVILTHAHLDHTGYLPLLVRQGFKGPIYATPATIELATILLRDAGHIQEEDALHAKKYGYSKHAEPKPLYTEQDAERVLQFFVSVDFEKEQWIGKDIQFVMKTAGHILGSSIVTLKAEGKTVVFTGDLGRPNDIFMKPPSTIETADYLIMESTYGNRLHPETNVIDTLGELIRKTVARGGTVLIPAFAVGRTQTLLYILYQLREQKAIPAVPIYLDSPMAEDVTDIMCHYGNEHRLAGDVCPAVGHIAQYVRTVDASKELDQKSQPSIILSASGMAEGGRVLYHLKRFLPDAKNTVIFAGFQAKMTRGDRLLRGEETIKIHGEQVPVHAEIENLDTLSSHADYKEILEWLQNFKSPPKIVFLTHGEEEASLALQKYIQDNLKWNVVVPNYLEEVEL